MNEVATGGTITEEKRLGQIVQTARRHAGLTQQALCQKSGLSYSTLAKIERGAIKSPSVFTIQQIAQTLGISLDQLLGGLPSSVVPPAAKKVSRSGIRFVYFDLNGCLVRFGSHGVTKLAEESLQPLEAIETVLWQYDRDVCRGARDISELNAALSERTGMPVDWRQYYLDVVEPVPGVAEFLEWAAENYRVGIMSNTMPGLIKALRERHCLPPVTYDAIVDSSEVHAIKPDPAIYEAAMERAGVGAHEILLVDNERANLATAAKLGWHTMRFDTFNPEESIVNISTALQPAD